MMQYQRLTSPLVSTLMNNDNNSMRDSSKCSTLKSKSKISTVNKDTVKSTIMLKLTFQAG